MKNPKVKNLASSSGFTLIEVMTTLLIISGLGLVSYQVMIMSQKDFSKNLTKMTSLLDEGYFLKGIVGQLNRSYVVKNTIISCSGSAALSSNKEDYSNRTITLKDEGDKLEFAYEEYSELGALQDASAELMDQIYRDIAYHERRLDILREQSALEFADASEPMNAIYSQRVSHEAEVTRLQGELSALSFNEGRPAIGVMDKSFFSNKDLVFVSKQTAPQMADAYYVVGEAAGQVIVVEKGAGDSYESNCEITGETELKDIFNFSRNDLATGSNALKIQNIKIIRYEVVVENKRKKLKMVVHPNYERIVDHDFEKMIITESWKKVIGLNPSGALSGNYIAKVDYTRAQTIDGRTIFRSTSLQSGYQLNPNLKNNTGAVTTPITSSPIYPNGSAKITDYFLAKECIDSNDDKIISTTPGGELDSCHLANNMDLYFIVFASLDENAQSNYNIKFKAPGLECWNLADMRTDSNNGQKYVPDTLSQKDEAYAPRDSAEGYYSLVCHFNITATSFAPNAHTIDIKVIAEYLDSNSGNLIPYVIVDPLVASLFNPTVVPALTASFSELPTCSKLAGIEGINPGKLNPMAVPKLPLLYLGAKSCLYNPGIDVEANWRPCVYRNTNGTWPLPGVTSLEKVRIAPLNLTFSPLDANKVGCL